MFRVHFPDFCLFENALVPFDDEQKRRWEQRKLHGRTGVVVSERINLPETTLPENVTPEIKSGTPAGRFAFGGIGINTELLHNTHSWVVVAVK